MPRPLKYPARRVVALTEDADILLAKIALRKNGMPVAELARLYVEDGIRRDRKLIQRPTVN